ncbi:hypothetical protein SAMN02787118_13087 [Streptomyces mirabilis]|uniref:Uncharacterized protein n=1 Tax=Streptomyces mirabilis TaxID=68239 RepID=A0A1I2V6G5_9ACTN|nr:hypothetical protein SAMN02787118_13087 [Streptomyces mirabilis]
MLWSRPGPGTNRRRSGAQRPDVQTRQDSAVKARTQAINQLKAVLVVADPALRERLSSLGNAELFRTCARLSWRDGDDEDAVARATHITLSLLAQRIEQLTGQIDALNQRLIRLVERHAARGRARPDARSPDASSDMPPEKLSRVPPL